MQRARGEVGHDDVGQALSFAEIKDRDDVRMAQAPQELDFSLEAGMKLGVVGEIGGKNLDRHPALVARVGRQEDARHASLADLFQKVVVADRPPDQSIQTLASLGWRPRGALRPSSAGGRNLRR